MKKPTATLSSLIHRGGKQIKVEIAFEDKERLKKIKGYKFSQTHKCFYLPYCPESFRQLEELFEVRTKQENRQPSTQPPSPIHPPSKQQNEKIFIRLEKENERRMKAFVPFFKKDWIEKIKNIPGRAWNDKEKYWSLPMTKKSVGQVKEWFGENAKWTFVISNDMAADYRPKNWKTQHSRKKTTDSNQQTIPPTNKDVQRVKFPEPSEDRKIFDNPFSVQPSYRIIKKEWGDQKIVVGGQIIVEQWDSHWLCAYVPGDKKGWLEAFRAIIGRRWIANASVWLLPITKETIQELGKFDENYLVKNFTIPTDIPERYPISKRGHKKRPLNEMQRLAIYALEERLRLEFKSEYTIKSYCNILKGLLFHYPQAKPSSITKNQINKYITYKIKEKRISSSYMNQIINSFNSFFGRLLQQDEKILHLERPKKDRKLPNFISSEEIKRLLEAIKNKKHKCMLILIYSAGLRKSELLNLRIKDMDQSTKSLFVKGGKGRKDRLTLYSPTAIKYVNEYLDVYNPKHWLFEGQTGGQYSASSLQSIFERAKEVSSINKRITIHGLRHSFATHLTYKGVPIHEIKRLLGHESIKTTEIYLHLANRYKSEIQSPLEDLDI